MSLFVLQAVSFKLSIVENGTTFSEDIEVKEKEGVEVFRVPAHNDVDGADFYHDFKKVRSCLVAVSHFDCNKNKQQKDISLPA